MTAATDHLVVTDARLDQDTFMLEGLDTSEGPHFSVSEVAKFFFARSPHWIRWRETKDDFVLDGRVVGNRRTEEGARYYTLSDVEEMAHALAHHGAINGSQLHLALTLVQAEARLHGYL